MKKFGRIALKIFLWTLGSLITMLLLVVILIRIPSVQNYLVSHATNFIENKIHTPVRIGYIHLSFPKKLVLKDIYLEDQSRDTLLAGELLKIDFDLWKILDNKVSVQSLELKGITAKIRRNLPDSSFNFDYILEAFSSPEKVDQVAVPENPSKQSSLQFDLGKIELTEIKAVYFDESTGMDLSMSLKQLKTRIDQFDLEGDMSFSFGDIAINGTSAVIKQWVPDNYEAVASNSTGLPHIGLGKINLQNIDIAYLDLSGGMDTRFSIKKFEGQIDELDLSKQKVSVDYFKLNGSKSHVVFQKSNTGAKVEADTSSSQNMNWQVRVNRLEITESDFLFRDDREKRIPKGFDYFNIGLVDLQTNLTDLQYLGDTIQGSLQELKVRDHSGLEIRKLHGDFLYTPQGADLQNLWLETPNTLIKDRLTLKYKDLASLSDQIGELFIHANLSTSHLSMQDVLFFMPELDTMKVLEKIWPQTFYIDAQVQGMLKDLSIPNLKIHTLENTVLIAQAQIGGLPLIENLNMNLQLTELTTTKNDLEQLIPTAILPDSIRIPYDIQMNGSIQGGLNDFDTKINLISSSGNVNLEGKYSVHHKNTLDIDTLYQAEISIDQLDLGYLLKMDSTLGRLSIRTQLKGQGLDIKKMNTEFQAQLIEMEFNAYPYRNIDIQGHAQKGIIHAKAESKDPNVDFQLQADADLSETYPKLNAEIMIDSVNLKNLGFLEDELRYHGKILVDLQTADIDYLNGSIKVQESSVALNKERYILDEIELVSKSTETINQIQLQAEFLQAHMTGQFSLTQLNEAIRDIIAVYYQPDSVSTTYNYNPQRFDFSARLIRSRFIQDFFPDLTAMRDMTLDLSFNSSEKFILAKALAPRIEYAGTVIDDIGFDLTTFDSTMYYSALIKKISVAEIDLINTLLSGSVVQNQLDFGLWIKDKSDREQYHIGMDMVVDAQNFILKLHENGLLLNYQKWEVSPENALSFGKDGIRTQDFQLSFGDQLMLLQSQDTSLNAPIDILFDNFRIETFSQLVESDILNIGGGISGMATISRLNANPVFVSDLTIDRFYFGKDTVGNVLMRVNNERENIFAADLYIVENGNYVNLVGDYIAVPGKEPKLDFKLDLRPMTLKTVEAFSFGYLRQTQGSMKGLINISGSPAKPVLNGELVFDKASMNVSMLNATFGLDDQRILFDQAGLRFNRFEMRDSKNNVAKLNGTILTKNYRDFDFNLNLQADHFQVLNSTKKDNDLYYGQMFISSNLAIRGNLNQPQVDGNLKIEDHTQVTFVLPNDDPGLVEREGIIKFVNKKDTVKTNYFGSLDSLTTTPLAGINLSVNIQTDENAEFSIVIDPGSGDALHVQGEAELTAGIDLSGKINLTGTYTVSQGSYSFTFEPVKRKFGFRKGSTITWAGDPLDARLAIIATHTVRAPSLELVQNQLGGERTNLYRQRVPFEVVLNISGEMFKPELKFSIDLDEGNAIISQDVASKVNTALAQLNENESEMNKQVFALIILQRFLAENPFESISGGGNVGSMALSSARNSVSSLLSSQLNRIAGDLIKGVDFDFDLQSGDDYSTGQALSRTDLNIGVSKMLFDDRLKITIGSNFELEGNARPGENTTNIAGDISIDYQLSKDGRYFLRAYRKNQYQVTLQGQFVETGIGFIINIDYDQFREIFMSSKRLADLADIDNKRITGRFDQFRLETDSTYRDSVRTIIRDSLLKNDPQFRERLKDSVGRQPATPTKPMPLERLEPRIRKEDSYED